MKNVNFFKTGALVAATASTLLASTMALGSDSSADGNFYNALEYSDGLLLRVELNEDGEENTNSVEMRLFSGGEIQSEADLDDAWAQSYEVDPSEEITEEEAEEDSSTWGWFHWGKHHHAKKHYNRGYNDGYGHGHNDGYDRGYNNGFSDGYHYRGCKRPGYYRDYVPSYKTSYRHYNYTRTTYTRESVSYGSRYRTYYYPRYSRY